MLEGVQSGLGQNLIFLACVPRSGSTLLQRILSCHPDVASASEPWIMLHPVYAMRETGIAAEYDHALSLVGLNEFLSLVPEKFDLYIEAIRKMGTHIYNEILKRFNKKYFLDKTPRYYMILGELRKIFPSAHIILLIRNPLAVLASTLSTWFDCDPEKLLNSKNYGDLTNGFRVIGNQIKSGDGGNIFVHYEDVVLDPFKTVEDLCNKIGVTFMPHMINYGNVDAVKSTLGDSTKINLYNRPVHCHSDDWVKFFISNNLSDFGKTFIESLGSEIVNVLGYDYDELKYRLSGSSIVAYSTSTLNLQNFDLKIESMKDLTNHQQTKIIIATSLAPGNEVVQKAAIDSWRINGFDVVSLNSEKEIDKIKSAYPEIEVVAVEKTSEYIFGKPYIFIDDILSVLHKLNPDICGIVNSDIIISHNSEIKRTLVGELENNCLVYGSRIEIESVNNLDGEFYNNGFDMFFFKPSLATKIPRSLASLGVTWWDYWLPLSAALAGTRLKKLNSPMGYHVSHPARWSDEQWKFMGFQIAKALYDRRIKISSLLCHHSQLFKLDTIVQSSGHFSLSNTLLYSFDKIQASYYNLQNLARSILVFLKSESRNIFPDKPENDSCERSNPIVYLNSKAEKEIDSDNLEIALKFLISALRIDENDPKTLCNLGVLFFKAGDISKAIYNFKTCLEKNPHDPMATWYCGKILAQQGQYHLAQKLFSIYLHENPGDVMVGRFFVDMQDKLGFSGYRGTPRMDL